MSVETAGDQALELRKNEKGVLRIRVAAGWVSEKAGSGQVILHEIKPLEPENEWEDIDGAELKEARSPKAAAEILKSGSQLAPPLEPMVEEGSAPWMVRATAVERAATKARAAHRSRCLKVKRVVRANEFSPMHVEGTAFTDAPVVSIPQSHPILITSPNPPLILRILTSSSAGSHYLTPSS